ncbi:MAG TPA: hypothetical protein VHW09_07370 [Bryobacteraceae bacterium]|jgi:hypothetical protein|nr:hypothetical protein [Bryobacteraceae bacterium]
MKLTIFLAGVALLSASAQPAPMKPDATSASAAKPSRALGATEAAPVPLQAIQGLETEMDSRIARTGAKTTPCNVLANTRGLYISGLGAVFSAEVELAPTPGGIGIFQTNVGPQQKAKYRGDKQANIPLLEKTLTDMVLVLANSPVLKLGDHDQVVVAARLFYRSWEDVTGLPGQIVAHLDRRGGTVKMEIQ